MELEGFGQSEGVDLLQKVPLFKKLSYEETQKLAQIIETQQLPTGATVIEENALGDALYVVLEGRVRVTRDLNKDGSHDEGELLGHLGEGELFGEMSLVDDLLTSARITTDERSRLLKIPRRRFEALLASDDKLALKVYRSFCQTLSDRLRKTNSLLEAEKAHKMGVR